MVTMQWIELRFDGAIKNHECPGYPPQYRNSTLDVDNTVIVGRKFSICGERLILY